MSSAVDTPKSAPQNAAMREFSLVLGGYAYFQALHAACELDLFTKLARMKAATLAELAEVCGVADYGMRVLLLACTSLRLVARNSDGRYRNEFVAEALLVGDNPQNLLPCVEAFARLIYPAMGNLTESIRGGTNAGLQTIPGQGETLYERLRAHPELSRVFYRWLKSAGAAANQHLAAAPSLAGVRRLLDIGGGDGEVATALLGRNPSLRITLFDLPEVCRHTRSALQLVASSALQLAEGDFFRDPFPNGHDAVLFCRILHIFSEKEIAHLLAKAYEAIEPGGKVIAFDYVASDEEDGPLGAAHLSLYFLALASGSGMTYPVRDYVARFQEAGFTDVRATRIAGSDHALILGTKA